MTAGALADTFGRKRVFASGVLAFVIISIVIAWAPGGILWLDVRARLRGIAAAAALARQVGGAAQAFDGMKRARERSACWAPALVWDWHRLRSWRACSSKHLGWRSVFFCACDGCSALLLGVPRMPESRDPDAAVLIGLARSVSLAPRFCSPGVLQLQASGWGSWLAWGCCWAPPCHWGFFLAWRTCGPPDAGSVAVSVSALPWACRCCRWPHACYVVLLVLLPLRLIGIEGKSEVSAGMIAIALSIPMLIVPSQRPP